MKVEVLKTNVLDAVDANRIIEWIHSKVIDCHANFDLEDCDHVLRVVSEKTIPVADLISILNTFGFDAEVLPDNIPEILLF